MRRTTTKVFLYALIRDAQVVYIGQTIMPYGRKCTHIRNHAGTVFVILRSGGEKLITRLERGFITNLKKQGFCQLNKNIPKNSLNRSRNKGIPVVIDGTKYPSRMEASRLRGVCLSTIYNEIAAAKLNAEKARACRANAKKPRKKKAE